MRNDEKTSEGNTMFTFIH